jgi:hypothetical protein
LAASLAAENKKYYFRHSLFSAANSLVAENYVIFSVAVVGPLKVSYFRRPRPGRRKYGLIFGYFFSGGQKPPKISLKPLKIAYFRQQRPYFRWLLAAENDCSSCSEQE